MPASSTIVLILTECLRAWLHWHHSHTYTWTTLAYQLYQERSESELKPIVNSGRMHVGYTVLAICCSMCSFIFKSPSLGFVFVCSLQNLVVLEARENMLRRIPLWVFCGAQNNWTLYLCVCFTLWPACSQIYWWVVCSSKTWSVQQRDWRAGMSIVCTTHTHLTLLSLSLSHLPLGVWVSCVSSGLTLTVYPIYLTWVID